MLTKVKLSMVLIVCCANLQFVQVNIEILRCVNSFTFKVDIKLALIIYHINNIIQEEV